MFSLIDLTVSLGNIFTVLATVGSVAVAVWRFSLVVTRLEAKYEMKVEMMWADYRHRKNIDGEKK